MKILKDFQGREIRLTDERLSHILEHREMAGLQELLEETLIRPVFVIESLSDPAVMLYYHSLAQRRVGVDWLCVVAKFSGEDAFVLTA